jgi:hypothetical protein
MLRNWRFRVQPRIRKQIIWKIRFKPPCIFLHPRCDFHNSQTQFCDFQWDFKSHKFHLSTNMRRGSWIEDYWRRPYHMAYGDLFDFWGPHLWLIQFLFFNSMIRLFYPVSTVSINIIYWNFSTLCAIFIHALPYEQSKLIFNLLVSVNNSVNINIKTDIAVEYDAI